MKVIGKSKKRFIAPKPPPKVYCKNCRFYKAPEPRVVIEYHYCTHKNYTTTKDTPIAPEHEYGDCMEINRNNDCPLFQDRAGNK